MTKQYNSLKEKIAAEKAERAQRNFEFQMLLGKAEKAGYAAGDNMTPRPMTVTDSSGNVIDQVNEGLCGFAWINVRSANKGFGNWLIKQGIARKGYYGGAEIWIHAHNQSYERKLAHARAMADIINEAGFECYANGRLD
jgi:hypothetical protein